MTPEGYTSHYKKELLVRTKYFFVIEGHLYKMGSGEILPQYVLDFERNNILAEAHGGVAGGHYVGKATTQNNLCMGLWWPTLHKDTKAYCRARDACQRMGKPLRRNELPLKG